MSLSLVIITLEVILAATVLIILPVRAYLRGFRQQGPMAPLRYIVETLCLLALLGIVIYFERVPPHAVGLAPVEIWLFLMHTLACVCVVVGFDLVAISLLLISRRTWSSRKGIAISVRNKVKRQLGLAFVAVCLFGAMWEELCFRGVGLALFPSGPLGQAIGVAVCSVLFALHHLRGGINAAMHAGFYGILFAIMYLVTADLWSVIVAHAVGNIFAAKFTAPCVTVLVDDPPVFI